MSKSSEEGAVDNSAPQNGSGEAAAQKDANASIYENRAGTKKIVRVVTVMAYVFSVSFTAILLSAYYIFIWVPPNPRLTQRSHLISDPQKLFMIPNIPNPDERLNNLEPMIGESDSEMLTNDPQKLMAPSSNFFQFYKSASSSAPSDDSRSPSVSPLTGVPISHIAEAESTTAENSFEDNVSVSLNPTTFLYATSLVTEVNENATTTEGETETPETMLANVGEIMENYIGHGTDLKSPDNTSFIKETVKFDKFSGSFKTPVKRNENRDETGDYRGLANRTTYSEAKEKDIQDSKLLPGILASGETVSTTPANIGAIIYRRLRLKFDGTSSPELIDDKVNDKVMTTGSPETTTDESMPKQPVAPQAMGKLRIQDETKPAETNPEELEYGEKTPRDSMKQRK